ncbi:ribosomal-processing cysteine protease Prp [Levilactobacillus brevis]|nr:ribosomal-processing cysteine protease Prp [Levilactobacillus brevis]
MIHATFHHGTNRIDSFQITGHADSGEYGQDIVCLRGVGACDHDC